MTTENLQTSNPVPTRVQRRGDRRRRPSIHTAGAIAAMLTFVVSLLILPGSRMQLGPVFGGDFASIEDVRIEAELVGPGGGGVDGALIFPGGSEGPMPYYDSNGCKSGKEQQYDFTDRAFRGNPYLSFSLSNAHVTGASGSLLVQNIRVNILQVVEHAKAIAIECQTGGEGASILVATIEKELLTPTVHAWGWPQPWLKDYAQDVASGAPIFEIDQGGSVQFDLALQSVQDTVEVEVLATVRNGDGDTWDINLTQTLDPLIIAGREQVGLLLTPYRGSEDELDELGFRTDDDGVVRGSENLLIFSCLDNPAYTARTTAGMLPCSFPSDRIPSIQ